MAPLPPAQVTARVTARVAARRLAVLVAGMALLACGTRANDAADAEDGSTPAESGGASGGSRPADPAPPDADPFVRRGLAELAPAARYGWPVERVHLTSDFGWRIDPVSGRGTRLHRGIDFRGGSRDLALSVADGQVSFAGHDGLHGNHVIIEHDGGLQSIYAHLTDVLVVQGVDVSRGAAIGVIGNTGRSQAPHLHLTIKKDGVAIDPLELLGHEPFDAAALVPDGPAR